jgi:hypothetical protein
MSNFKILSYTSPTYASRTDIMRMLQMSTSQTSMLQTLTPHMSMLKTPTLQTPTPQTSMLQMTKSTLQTSTYRSVSDIIWYDNFKTWKLKIDFLIYPALKIKQFFRILVPHTRKPLSTKNQPILGNFWKFDFLPQGKKMKKVFSPNFTKVVSNVLELCPDHENAGHPAKNSSC